MGGFLLWLLFSFYLFNFFHEVSFYNGQLNNYVIEAQLMPLHLPRKLEIQDTYFIFHCFFFEADAFYMPSKTMMPRILLIGLYMKERQGT